MGESAETDSQLSSLGAFSWTVKGAKRFDLATTAFCEYCDFQSSFPAHNCTCFSHQSCEANMVSIGVRGTTD